jgi:hypothetical protein
MGRVTLYFSESDYKLFNHYCGNYYRLHGETRKNSIHILLELYKDQVIDIQENNLDNIFAFFYYKKQEFETECLASNGAFQMMQARLCADIISFLEDLEKICLILRKKGVEANYVLLMGVFSRIIAEKNQMQFDDLNETGSGAIDAITTPLREWIEKKTGPDADIPEILNELVRFVATFNRLSLDVTFTDEIIPLIAISLLKKFGKKADYEDITIMFKDQLDQFEMDELESALEGGLHARNVWGLEYSWEILIDPLRTLQEMVMKRQNAMRVSLDVLSALEKPLKTTPAPTEMILFQEPYRGMRRQRDKNLFLIQVDNRKHTTVQLSSPLYPISPDGTNENTYKKYYPLISGIIVLAIIVLACILVSIPSLSEPSEQNLPRSFLGASNGTTSHNGTIALSNSSQKAPIKTVTPVPTPKPTPQYVTIEPVLKEPDTSPKSHQDELNELALVPDLLYDPKEYITIFKNNMSYNLENAYKISFDVKNPPMIIRYTVYSQNITDIKWFEPRDSARKIDTAVVNRSDESAWFEIKISDNDGLYEKVGWGRIYGIPSDMQQIVLRTENMYQIEFSGQKVTVDLEVLVKKEGNIK